MENRRDSCEQDLDLAGQRAGDLLRAWISGDSRRLEHELESILRDASSPRDAGEEERRHLLRAVAQRMKQFPDVFGSPRKAGIELCLNLLGHLITEEAGNAKPEWAGTEGCFLDDGHTCVRLTYTANGNRPGLRLV